MANPPAYPADLIPNIHSPPPPVSSNGSIVFTPQSASVADDSGSDSEDIPTPILSPRGGPQYDDLPPSYDEAQHQAVNDARNGLTPLDPNQLEAHRLTLNEGPGESEVWEYRVRGEEQEENERAPEYTNALGATVPIQHNGGSESIHVGRIGRDDAPTYTAPDPTAALLERALSFTRLAPDSDTPYAPRLERPVAIPQQTVRRSDDEPVQFLRAGARPLDAYSIRPADFAEFLDGLNALCASANTTSAELVSTDLTPDIVEDYITGINEAFFAPRGLRVSIRSSSSLMEVTTPSSDGARYAGLAATRADQMYSAELRADALSSRIETLEYNLPAPSTQSRSLREMGKQIRDLSSASDTARVDQNEKSRKRSVDENRDETAEDPPHSIPEGPTSPRHASVSGLREHHAHVSLSGPRQYWDPSRRGNGRRGQRGAPWTPFGAGVHGPFGTGNGPWGAMGNGPFGPAGNGPFGPLGNGPFGLPGHGRFGAPGRRTDHYRTVTPTADDQFGGGCDDLARRGEAFGRRMGELGQQIGKQAEAWGQDVGKRAAAWGEEVTARASGSGNGNSSYQQTETARPPSYSEGQETGVLRGPSSRGPNADQVQYLDDDSSNSSDTDTDTDSDFDDDDDDLPDTQAIFLARVQSINAEADLAISNGKKSPAEIFQDRALGITTAQAEKTTMDAEIVSGRAAKRELRHKRRELKKQHRQTKRELKGKGKGKAKKTMEWKEAKKEYKLKKKGLRCEKVRVKRELKGKLKKEGSRGIGREGKEERHVGGAKVWIVVENLGE